MDLCNESQKALGHSLSLRGYFSLLDFIMKVFFKFSADNLAGRSCLYCVVTKAIHFLVTNDLHWCLHKSASMDY